MQQYGKDATLDGTGTITAGTALPAMALAASTTTVGYSVDGISNGSCGPGTFCLGYGDNFYVGDFNGDGKADLFHQGCCVTNGQAELWISTGTSFTVYGISTGGQCGPGTWCLGYGDKFYAGDFNGDGKADLFRLGC